MSDDIPTEPTVLSDKLVPIDRDKQLITSNGNDAAILGLLDEFHKWAIRNGLFEYLFKYRAVASASKIAVLDPSVSTLILQGNLDTHGSVFIENPLAVKTEDSKLLTSLGHIFGEHYDELIEDAQGSGLDLLAALRLRATNASTADLAVLTADFDKTKSDGVQGELTVDSLKSFVWHYKIAKRHLPPGAQPGAPSEINMINLIAFKDSTVFHLYELKAASTPPTSLDSAVTILRGILTSRVRSEELEQAKSGSKLLSAASTRRASPAKPESDADKILALLAKLNSKLSKPGPVADPNKDVGPNDRRSGRGKGKGGGRGREGRGGRGRGRGDRYDRDRERGERPMKWTEDMRGCYHCGGRHLDKDCDKKETKETMETKETNAANAAVDGATKEQILHEVKAYLDAMEASSGSDAAAEVHDGQAAVSLTECSYSSSVIFTASPL